MQSRDASVGAGEETAAGDDAQLASTQGDSDATDTDTDTDTDSENSGRLFVDSPHQMSDGVTPDGHLMLVPRSLAQVRRLT